MKRLFILAFTIASAIASFALYAGIRHNPMGVFCKNGNLDDCSFDFSYAAFIWLSWFAVSFFLQAVIIISGFLMKKTMARLSGRRAKG